MADKDEDKKEIVDAKQRKKKATLAVAAAFVAALGTGGYTLYEGAIVPMQAWDTLRSGDYEQATSYLQNMDGRDYESREFRNRILEHYMQERQPIPRDVLKAFVDNIPSPDTHYTLLNYSDKVGDSAAIDYILKYSPYAGELLSSENIGTFAFHGNIRILSRLQDQGVLNDEVATELMKRAMLGRQIETMRWLDQNYTINTAQVNKLYAYFFIERGITDESEGRGEIRLALSYNGENAADQAARRQVITWMQQHGPVPVEDIVRIVRENSRFYDADMIRQVLLTVELGPQQSRELMVRYIGRPEEAAFFLESYSYSQEAYAQAFEQLLGQEGDARQQSMTLLLQHYTPAQEIVDQAVKNAFERNDNETIAILGQFFDIPETLTNESFLNAVSRNRVSEAARALQNVTSAEVKSQALVKAAEEGYDDMIWAFSQMGMEVSEGTYDKAFTAAFEHREYGTAILIRNTFPVKQETIAQAVQILIFDGNIRLARELSAIPQQNSPGMRP